MTDDRAMTPEQFREYDRVSRLRPKESDFIGKPGYKRTYRKDGTYSWRYRYKPNHGENRPTKESAEVWERMKPFVAADTARKLSRERPAKAVLRDQDGGVRYLDPALADKAARRNGWTHYWRAAGNRVERGIDGMLFRSAPRGWEPLGVRCLGAPATAEAAAPLPSPQRDPFGNEWVAAGDGWVLA